MAEIHVRKAANMLNVTESSFYEFLKEGNFKSTIAKPVGKGNRIPMYFLDDEDPLFLAILDAREKGEPLPEGLVGLEEAPPKKPKKSRKKKKAEEEEEPPASSGIPFVDLNEFQARREFESRVVSHFGEKSGYRTEIFQVDEKHHRAVFNRLIEDVPDFPTLQELFPGGGDFLFKVYRRKQSNTGKIAWEYEPKFSRDDPMDPVSVGPSPDYDPEEGAEPSGRGGQDESFAQDLARRHVDHLEAATRQPRDSGDGIAGVVGNLLGAQSESTRELITILSQQNQSVLAQISTAFGGMRQGIEEQVVLMREQAKLAQEAAEKRHAQELEKLDKRFGEDRQRDEERAKRERTMERERADERIAQQQRHYEVLKEMNDKTLSGLKEIEAERRSLDRENITKAMERVERLSQDQQDRFNERVEYLNELHELRSSMAPSQIWADVAKSIGGEIKGLAQALQPMLSGAGGNPLLQKPEAPAPGAEQRGGPAVGVNILNIIKQNPQYKPLFVEILTDMAKFVAEDDPPFMVTQSLLAMNQTIPAFPAILMQLYKLDIEEIVAGLLEPGPVRDALVSDKGKAFWSAVKAGIKAAYVEAASAGAAPAAAEPPPASGGQG